MHLVPRLQHVVCSGSSVHGRLLHETPGAGCVVRVRLTVGKRWGAMRFSSMSDSTGLVQ